MKTLMIAVLLTVPSAHALSLPDLLKAYPSHHPEVLQARQDLQQSEAEFRRTEQDPDTLAFERLKASHKQSRLKARLQQTVLTSQKSLTDRYWSLFIKTRMLQELPWKQKLAETKLNIARTRKSTGAGTQQEVQQAEQDLRSLKAEADQTVLEVEQLCQELSQQTGLKIQPNTPLTEPAVKTTLPAFKVQIEFRVDVLEAQQNVAEAELQLKLLDPIFNSRRDQEERQAALEGAKTSLESTEAAARRDIQKARDDFKKAVSQLFLAEDQLKTQESTYSKDQQKHQQGILAQIKLLESEASLRDSRRKLLEARQQVADSWASLAVALNQPMADPQEKSQ
ncbi:TolC family protein [Deinococcus cellulosilyticus]|uniref:Uncharacterized protein n=1 Tax=Deinococcus cellulosilyticus (strain DSM 18568 / NBRC 106333 / KACC 11606 / 5516J-15) TaxID=1223518 RepID=A0A511N1U7_DEIC1|nr:TolC family protein [Deinococcus cellulosilyticus]GEM46346.1 hypothetical protein DC3_19810 [Deinococcus cellulosilyticus NBRC 106333 = KACC 11606]